MKKTSGSYYFRREEESRPPDEVYETLEEQRRREEQRRVFIKGLERYQSRGIPVLVDGKVCGNGDLERLFAAERRAFYMGDFIPDERGILKEIHFNKVRY